MDWPIISWLKKHFPVTRNRLKPRTDPNLRSWHERTEPTKEEVILSLRRAKAEKCMRVKWMKWRVFISPQKPFGPLSLPMAPTCCSVASCINDLYVLFPLWCLLILFSKEQKPFFMVSICFQGWGGAKCLVCKAFILWFIQEVCNITWNQGSERQKLNLLKCSRYLYQSWWGSLTSYPDLNVQE